MIVGDYTTLSYPSYIGEYNPPRTGDPGLSQPGLNGMTEILNTAQVTVMHYIYESICKVIFFRE